MSENQLINHLENTFKEMKISISQLEKLYPRLYEPMMTLAVTGITPRTYFNWKENKLVDSHPLSKEDKGKDRIWVRINLIDYVWLKIIETMREFGIPLKTIKETKEILFANYLEILVEGKKEIIDFLKKDNKESKARIAQIEKTLDIYKELRDKSPQEYAVYHSVLGSLLVELLIGNDNSFITICKKGEAFEIDLFSYKAYALLGEMMGPLPKPNCLYISIKDLVKDFLEDEETEKFTETLELLNLKERKVIEAIRKKDFNEIIIKPNNNGDDIIIKRQIQGNIINEKAKEVKRILGLNEYSEVTIKYRNDKNLFFTSKVRLE